MTDRPYHHGDLPRTVLEVTVAAIAEHGPAGVRLRDVARRAGVAHTSVTHHFGDKAGLLGQVAAEGHRLLAEELRDVEQRGAGFLEMGVAYVRFAVRNRPYFEVMFRPELYRVGDPGVAEARAVTFALLGSGAAEIADDPARPTTTAIAGWSLVHGLATLWLDGALPPDLGDDPEDITRRVAAELGRRDG
jgi:AcrR family transcriptional regulator